MFGRRKAGAKRFTLLLLEEEEDYVQDWVGRCRYGGLGGAQDWRGEHAWQLPCVAVTVRGAWLTRARCGMVCVGAPRALPRFPGCPLLCQQQPHVPPRRWPPSVRAFSIVHLQQQSAHARTAQVAAQHRRQLPGRG